jgi:hypothetical protein
VETSGTFSDRETDEEAYWNVRSTPYGVALTLSLASDGDVQVVLDRETATSLAKALLDATADLK